MHTHGKGAIKQSSNKTTITPQMQTVLDYLAEHEKMNEVELQELLNIKRTRAYTLAKEMEAAGLIKIVGRGKERQYPAALQRYKLDTPLLAAGSLIAIALFYRNIGIRHIFSNGGNTYLPSTFSFENGDF